MTFASCAGAPPDAVPTMGPPSVSDAEFRAFQTLIYAEAGIHLNASKKALLAGRLARRLRELGLRRLAEYHRYVTEHPEEIVQLLDRITTNETRFFREPAQFELLENELLPRWQADAAGGRRPRRIRAWSAGCSSGEEPFSLAMTLLSQCPAEAGWEIQVVASDLSTRVLRKAQEAVWPLERARHIPDRLLKRFMLRGVRTQAGLVKAGQELRDVVRFDRLNLMAQEAPSFDKFDLIFCRNVLIYFDAASKARVLARLISHLAADGYLFLGHAESLGRTEPPMRSVAPNVYRLAA